MLFSPKRKISLIQNLRSLFSEISLKSSKVNSFYPKVYGVFTMRMAQAKNNPVSFYALITPPVLVTVVAAWLFATQQVTTNSLVAKTVVILMYVASYLAAPGTKIVLILYDI